MNEDSTLHNRGGTVKGTGKAGLQVDQLQCLNFRGRAVTCTRCADACPARALKLTADAVHLEAELCTNCGACLPVCPSGAMQLTEFDPRQFLETLTGGDEVHIYCSRSDDVDDGNMVPCLQVLDARLLAAAAAGGAETVVLHGTSQCSSCDRRDARAAVEQLHTDLEAWFIDAPVHLKQAKHAPAEAGEQLGEDQVNLERRNFLRFAGAYAANSASKWLVDAAPEPQAENSQWPLFPSDGSTGRPAAYQELLAEQAGALRWRDHQLPWRSRTFSDACNTCLTCTQRCPTGALVAEETESSIVIWFGLHLCTDCGLCERLCPESAISAVSVMHPEELRAPPLRVMHRSLRQCIVCSRSFDPGQDSAELCTICQNEQDVANDWKAIFTNSS
ncbi:MAG: 4Fe-4S binding protein [Gammaproteobacteria bacterium]|nr:MAG: 4Fe-4S binding protein [Gammaproteobacteria bacterium]